MGRKIGFTNRALWALYGVDAPIWGDVTDATLHDPDDLDEGLPVAGYCEPKIEPEIVLGLSEAPRAGMDEAALGRCIGWVATGFEIVQSIYPGWRFGLADTVIAGALHGCLVVGRRVPAGELDLDALPDAGVELFRDGTLVERGRGANALDGPLAALRHIVELLAGDPDNPPLAAGELVSTGTLTDALPVSAGETWEARFSRVPLPPIRMRVT